MKSRKCGQLATRDARWVGILALLARLAVVAWAWNRVPPTADGVFYDQVARRIADGLGYTWLWPDGTVTYAAHYPVGYPAALGAVYAVFAEHPGMGMLLNAIVGAAGCWAMYGLTVASLKRLAESQDGLDDQRLRQACVGAGVVIALFPTLLLYTPALMTEGMVASLLALAARATLGLRRQEISYAVGAPLLLLLCAAATMVRPQSILFAPLFGFALRFDGSGGWVRSLGTGAVVLAVTVGLCLPWTFRNCERMDRCVFVSANAGWNLLIGTFPDGQGAWIPLEGHRVPVECREVFAEAHKDSCFKNAGLRRIAARPLQWVSLVPVKWRATFDYTASASAHLKEAGTLGSTGRAVVAALELATQRLWFLAGLLGVWLHRSLHGRASSRPPSAAKKGRLAWDKVALLLGILGFAGLGAWVGWLCLVLLLLPRFPWTRDLGLGLIVWAVLFTAAVHGVFFGAGRYAMPLILWVMPLAAAGLLQVRAWMATRPKVTFGRGQKF